MDETAFNDRLKGLGLTRSGFALLFGLDRGTAGGWGKLRNGRPSHVPRWVPFALTLLEDRKIGYHPPPSIHPKK